MKAIVMYSSITGNTRKIAKCIAPQIEDCVMIETKELDTKSFFATQLDNFDIFYIGYWVFQGDCDTLTAHLATHLHDKTIVLFGTLGAAENTAYYDKIKANVEKHFADNHVIGHFLCQGAIGKETIKRYKTLVKENPDDEHLRMQLENYENGVTHPDQKDMEKAIHFVLEFN